MASYTYRIKLVVGLIDTSVCPPDFLSAIFPGFDNTQTVLLTASACYVTFDSLQTLVDLGPTIRVDLMPEGTDLSSLIP